MRSPRRVKYEAAEDVTYVHAYDDLLVMAGQGTLADEVVLSGHGPFDVAYLQIGGGGMAAAASNWLKTYWPGIEIVGVEGSGQASMLAALQAGEPVALREVDIFATARLCGRRERCHSRFAGRISRRLETVTNEQVNFAIRTLWEGLRCDLRTVRSDGTRGRAEESRRAGGKRVLVVIAGANIDFLQLGLIARSEGASSTAERAFRIRIPERVGSMLELLDSCFGGINVADFQHGIQNLVDSWPVFTVSAEEPGALDEFPSRLDAAGVRVGRSDRRGGCRFPRCAAADETAEASRLPASGLLRAARRFARLPRPADSRPRGVAYFNYRESGESVGRALIGLDFQTEGEREAFLVGLPEQGEGYRTCTPVDSATLARLTK